MRLVALLLLSLSALAQVDVLTYQYGPSRAGVNRFETVLTSANVSSSQFGKLFSYPVDGYVYAQPLIATGVYISGKGLHNVAYVVTEHDSVYAFDADSNIGPNGQPLWHVSFVDPASGVTSVPASDTNCDQITPEIGITSTPVIDPVAGTLYTVAMTKEVSGAAVNYVHRLHALDITSGAERPGSPVVIEATYPGTGEGGSTLTFRAHDYKQRPGLVLWNGVVYTTWSSHCDIGRYHGWVMGYDAKTLKQVVVWNVTPNGNEASFWASGAAPAIDSGGNMYLVAGNGTFDYSSGGPDLGESYVKLSTSNGRLSVADYFTPFNADDLNAGDTDVGSAGVALLGDEAGSPAHPHLMVGAGKEGRVYLLDRDNMGKFHAGSDAIVQSIPEGVGSLFGNPAYFNGAVYLCGSGDNLKAFPVSNATLSPPSSRTADQFRYPGCVPSISANGTSNGIAWVMDLTSTLHAYDASDLTRELYNSNQNSARDALDSFVKFSVPTIANAKVYSGTQTSLSVYGLLPGNAPVNAGGAAGGVAAVAPGSMVALYIPALTRSAPPIDSFPLPTSLAGVSVSVDGMLAPLIYAGPGQINAQVPFEAPAGTGTVVVTIDGRVAGTATVIVQSSAPGLFTLDTGRAAVVNQDGTVNSLASPAPSGTVVSAYLTGLGAVDNPVATGAPAGSDPLSRVASEVTATVGGVPATVSFAGLAPGFAGFYQVNLTIPQLSPGDYPLQISAGGVASNSANLAVR